MPAELSATAFMRRSRPTTSGIIAWRAGIISAIVMPCTTEAANRCQSSIVFVRIRAPITRAFSTETNCPAWSTIFFGARSARRPPNMLSTSMGRDEARAIPPSAANEPVISKAT